MNGNGYFNITMSKDYSVDRRRPAPKTTLPRQSHSKSSGRPRTVAECSVGDCHNNQRCGENEIHKWVKRVARHHPKRKSSSRGNALGYVAFKNASYRDDLR